MIHINKEIEKLSKRVMSHELKKLCVDLCFFGDGIENALYEKLDSLEEWSDCKRVVRHIFRRTVMCNKIVQPISSKEINEGKPSMGIAGISISEVEVNGRLENLRRLGFVTTIYSRRECVRLTGLHISRLIDESIKTWERRQVKMSNILIESHRLWRPLFGVFERMRDMRVDSLASAKSEIANMLRNPSPKGVETPTEEVNQHGG